VCATIINGRRPHVAARTLYVELIRIGTSREKRKYVIILRAHLWPHTSTRVHVQRPRCTIRLIPLVVLYTYTALAASRLSSNYIIRYNNAQHLSIVTAVVSFARAELAAHRYVGKTIRRPNLEIYYQRRDSATFYTSRVRTSSPPR